MLRIRPFAELITPNDPALRFTPLGFSTGGRMTPEAAAEHIQRSIGIELAPTVPDSTRQSFERVCLTHTYGLFAYDLFTVAEDHALLVLEQALAEKFVDYYGGTIPLIAADGTELRLPVRSFDEVYRAVRRRPAASRNVGSLLRPGERIEFNAGFGDLFSWARREGLLHGQRTRRLDKVFVRMRNRAAHPTTFQRTAPNYSAGMIRDVGEIINRIWGSPIPGGRLYPDPIRREIFGIGWSPDGTHLARPWADKLLEADERDGWKWILVRAVEQDDVWGFHSDFATTQYPAELLWGPGTVREAIAWFESTLPEGDEVEYLDRWFVVRTSTEEVDPPRTTEQFLGLPEDARAGSWLLAKADYPTDAYRHARSLLTGGSSCRPLGECDECAVQVEAMGDWEAIDRAIHRAGLVLQPRQPVGVRAESEIGRWPYP